MLAGAFVTVGVLGACSDGAPSTVEVAGSSDSTEIAPETVPSPTTVATTAVVEATADTASEQASPDPMIDVLDGVWAEYRETTRTQDGLAAADLVSAGAFDWYDQVLTLALEADGTELIADAKLSEALLAVIARAEHGETLSSMNGGRDLFVARVETGSTYRELDADGFDRYSIASAHAFGILGGENTVRFESQADGSWTVDPSLIHVSFYDQPIIEDVIIELTTGGAASDRLGLFVWYADLSGTTWDQLSQPINGP